MPDNLATWALYGLIAVYSIGGIVNIVGPKGVRDSFVAWGYPRWFNYVTGALELLAVAMILYAPTQLYGVALGAVIMVAALASLVLNRAWNHAPGPVLMLVLTAIWLVAG